MSDLIKGVDFTGVTVVFACHDGAGNFLLAQRGAGARDEWGTWDPGAGALEKGKSIDETLREEIMQEYGARFFSKEFLGHREVFRRDNEGRQTHWIALDYKVWVDRRMVRNAEPHKLDKIGWFRLDDLPSPLHSQFPFFLNKYKYVLTRPTGSRLTR